VSRADLSLSILWRNRQTEAHLVLRLKPRIRRGDLMPKSTNQSCRFWGPTWETLHQLGFEAKPGETVITSFEVKLEKIVTAGFETKPLETVATGFEVKPLEIVAIGFEAKPVKTVTASFEAKPLETVDLDFKVQPRNPCS
jgi:hypothetical protein